MNDKAKWMEELTAQLSKIRFPDLPESAALNIWYRIPAGEARTAEGKKLHAQINYGTENKVLFMFHGGGVSWNEYMAARPRPFTDVAMEDLFYYNDTLAISDAVAPVGITDKEKEQNPFRDWTIISIPYNTGDLHCGNAEYPYRDQKNKSQILYHYGYRNFINYMEQIRDSLGYPEQIVISGYSAGAFGAALLSDTIMDMFPDCHNVVCLTDGCLIPYDNWPDAVRNVWKAPERICRNVQGRHIVADHLREVQKNYQDRFRLLFVASVRDGVLSQIITYIRKGSQCYDYESILEYQKALKEMCEIIQRDLPDTSFYLYDTPEGEEKEGLYPTRHTIIHSPIAYTVSVDGKTVVNWIAEELRGKRSSPGLSKL